jgi:hypothetical protein
MASSSEFYRVLAECIETVESGQATVESCLVRYPEHRSELQQLLPLVTALHDVPRVAPPPEFRDGARQRLLAQLPPIHGHVTREPLAQHNKPTMRPLASRSRFRVAWIAVIAVIATVLAGGGMAYAADSAAPGDVLYGLDRSIEQMRIELTKNPQAAFELQLALATERLKEADKALGKAKKDQFNRALDSYDATVELIAETVQSSAAADKTVLGFLLDEAIASHDALLADMVYGEREGEMIQQRDSDQDHWCLEGEDVHPVAERLAEDYDVSYEEIIGWFCDGFGFGEIGLAYQISAESVNETPVEELFEARHATNMGWGLIMQDEGLIGRRPEAGPPEGVPQGPPERQGPPEGVPPGRSDDAESPEDAEPPEDEDAPQGQSQGNGPPSDVPQGPPDHAGGPDDPGPPDGVPQGRPDEKGLPPGQAKDKP